LNVQYGLIMLAYRTSTRPSVRLSTYSLPDIPREAQQGQKLKVVEKSTPGLF